MKLPPPDHPTVVLGEDDVEDWNAAFVLSNAHDVFRARGDPIYGLATLLLAIDLELVPPRDVLEWLARAARQYFLEGRQLGDLERALGLGRGRGRGLPLNRYAAQVAEWRQQAMLHELVTLGATIPQAAALVHARLEMDPDVKRTPSVATLENKYRRGFRVKLAKSERRRPKDRQPPMPRTVERILGMYPDTDLEGRQGKARIRRRVETLYGKDPASRTFARR
jgi:hypothetical protein